MHRMLPTAAAGGLLAAALLAPSAPAAKKCRSDEAKAGSLCVKKVIVAPNATVRIEPGPAESTIVDLRMSKQQPMTCEKPIASGRTTYNVVVQVPFKGKPAIKGTQRLADITAKIDAKYTGPKTIKVAKIDLALQYPEGLCTVKVRNVTIRGR